MKENTSTLTDLNATIGLVASSMLDGSMTLKDGKADLTMVQVQLHALNPSFDNGVLSLLEIAKKTRTKKDLESDCRSILAHWGGINATEEETRETTAPGAFAEGYGKTRPDWDSYDALRGESGLVEGYDGHEVAKAEAKAIADNEEEPTSFLDELAEEIKASLDTATAAYLKAGELLVQGLEEVKESGKKQADFITWADEKCGVKKAQAYKLMSVYKTFGNDSDFNGVSMRVLYTLTGQGDKVVDLARAAAVKGKLDTPALNSIIEGVNGPKEKKAPVLPPAPKSPATPAPSKGEPVNADQTKEIEELKAQVADERRKREEAVDAALEMAGPSDHEEDNDPSLIKAMQKTIDELNKTVSALTDELRTAKSAPVDKVSASSPAAMPHLPQFDSASMPCRLGLEMEYCEDKVRINKAYRALAKFYTAALNPEAAASLKEARERLLKSAK